MNRQIARLQPERDDVVIAATFVAEPIAPPLRFVFETAGLSLEVKFADYNQVFQELLSPAGLLAKNVGGVGIILVRIEDFIRDTEDDAAAQGLIDQVVPELNSALRRYVRVAQSPTIFGVLPVSPSASRALAGKLEVATAALLALVQAVPGVVLLAAQDIDRVSTKEQYDDVSNTLAHIPYTEEGFAALALAVARKIHALRVPAQKVLVLDCDETLWRGVVGEDGPEGITVPPALARLQRFAVEIQEQGALVCLASKNSERDVLDVFEKRPEMVLKLDHVVARRVNWESKPRNIASLAWTLNLGLDSFVFIDDNPVECALMQSELPQVMTLRLPPEQEIESFVTHLWAFDKVAVTNEDTRRTTMYRENAARQESEESATDIADFIASLAVVVDIAAPNEDEWSRLAQLTQRTNQFNFTTVRRTESELRALATHGDLVSRIRVRDRFGDYGIIGLVIARPAGDAVLVDTFLLSCRVLGRGVEHSILRHLGEIARARGLLFVVVPFIRTAKNEPAFAFIESVAKDFREEAAGQVNYRLEPAFAAAIAHRPGHDPAAVVEARKADERKGVSVASTSDAHGRSERYATMTRLFASDVILLNRLRGTATRERAAAEAAIPARTETERRLLGLWQDLLRIDGLGIEDDFFASGGTSLLAARLFAQITRRFGARLPLTTILEFSTVRSLARRLDEEKRSAESINGSSGNLIELKSGGPRHLFLVHDGDGETLLYRNLACRMPDDLAVWGVEPRRLSKIRLAHTSIEDMAAFYVAEIRRRQPQGPYLLGGMCAGGVIAYAMAVQLEKVGEKVDLVALLDAAAPGAAKKPGLLTKARLNRVQQAIEQSRQAGQSKLRRSAVISATVAQKAYNALCWELTDRLRRLSVKTRFGLLRKVLVSHGRWPRLVSELTVRQIYDTAEGHYVAPALKETPTVLIRAEHGEGDDMAYQDIYADTQFGWSRLAPDLTVIDVAGGHSSMLQEDFVDSLADALRPFVVSHRANADRKIRSRLASSSAQAVQAAE